MKNQLSFRPLFSHGVLENESGVIFDMVMREKEKFTVSIFDERGNFIKTKVLIKLESKIELLT